MAPGRPTRPRPRSGRSPRREARSPASPRPPRSPRGRSAPRRARSPVQEAVRGQALREPSRGCPLPDRQGLRPEQGIGLDLGADVRGHRLKLALGKARRLQEARPEGRDLQGQVADKASHLAVQQRACRPGPALHEDADPPLAVEVGLDELPLPPAEPGEATERDLLPERRAQARDQGREPAVGLREAPVPRGLGGLSARGQEGSGAGGEVRLAGELEEGRSLGAAGREDPPFPGLPLLAPGRPREAPFSQEGGGRLEVAQGGLEGLPAVEHAGLRPRAELLQGGDIDLHGIPPPSSRREPPRANHIGYI